MDPSPLKPFDEEARQHGFDPDWLLAYAREHLTSPPEFINQPVDHAAVIKPLLDQLNRHPISAIWVANFKSFGAKPQRFPLAPVTLVFGPNSAGKSSLMQALLYAQHALLENQLDVKHPRGAGTLVDLGGFQNILHRHTENGVLTFGFEFAHHWRRLGEDSIPAIWWVEVGTRFREDEFIRDGGLRVLRARLEVDGEQWANLTSSGHFEPSYAHLDHEVRIGKFISGHGYEFRGSREACLKIFGEIDDQSVGESSFAHQEFITAISAHLMECTKLSLDGLVPKTYTYTRNYSDDYNSITSLVAYAGAHHGFNLDNFERDLLNPLVREIELRVSIISTTLSSTLRSLEYLASARTLPGRDFENINFRDRNHPHNGGSSWDVLRSAEGKAIRVRLNEWFADLAKREKRKGLAQYRFDTSYDLNRNLAEAIIERESENYLNAVERIMLDAINASHDDEVVEVNTQAIFENIDSSELTARIKIALADPSQGATTNHRLQIIDARVGRPVTPADIGVGIQYLIPVLVEILGDHTGTKIIEEPELHAHPALQAELGDALIEGALRESSPGRFIIETHSEHLILRILRRIREASEGSGNYPENLPKVRPEDVAVVYAEPSSEGTILHNLRIDSDGRFLDDWPTGFFAERLDEVL